MKQVVSGNGLAPFALCDRFQKHGLELGIYLERLFIIERQESHVRSFGQFGIHDDPTIDHFSRCGLHGPRILTERAG